jgi:hypothetical protein
VIYITDVLVRVIGCNGIDNVVTVLTYPADASHGRVHADLGVVSGHWSIVQVSLQVRIGEHATFWRS